MKLLIKSILIFAGLFSIQNVGISIIYDTLFDQGVVIRYV